MLPTTGTPTSDMPCTESSSSKTATGISPASGWRNISRTADAAAPRVPTMATRRPLPRAALPGEDARVETDQAHAAGREDQAEQHHSRVEQLIPGQPDERIHDHEDGGDGDGREDHLPCLFQPGVLPHAPVQPVHAVADEGHDHHDEDEDAEVPAVLGRCDVAPVEDLGHAVRRHHAGGVEDHEEQLGAHLAGPHRYLSRERHGPAVGLTGRHQGPGRAHRPSGPSSRCAQPCRGVDNQPRRVKLFPRSPEARRKCSGLSGSS